MFSLSLKPARAAGRCFGPVVALTLGLAGSLAWAQTPADPAAGWRRANEAVGRFLRGHIDVLKAEGPSPAPATSAVQAPLRQAQDGVAAALAHQPGLWLTPGLSETDTSRRRQEVVQLSLRTQQAWVAAVAAAQLARQQAQVLEAATLGAELARRMTQVGNWSEARRLQEEQLRLQALDTQQALNLQALETRLSWVRLAHQPLGATPAAALPALEMGDLRPADAALAAARDAWAQRPDWQTLNARHQQALRALPADLLPHWRARLDALAGTVQPAETLGLWTAPPRLDRREAAWPHALTEAWALDAQAQSLSLRLQTQAETAWARWQHHRAASQRLQQDSLPLLRQQQQETQLRYNGMLQSTWDLLASVRARLQGEQAATAALRDAWLAHLDWQAVLAGADPTGLAGGPAPSSNTSNASGGH